MRYLLDRAGMVLALAFLGDLWFQRVFAYPATFQHIGERVAYQAGLLVSDLPVFIILGGIAALIARYGLKQQFSYRLAIVCIGLGAVVNAVVLYPAMGYFTLRWATS